ncbi:phosphatase PAP2 family protein [Flavobacterium selenitireducens]|uniref:phosphatase PAP2 family protein n=1 Tax=Flavobacterium selenitireducens TaxID=2722704 RepID=UPI00168C079D|nr:phosphatase PAP2 family protein [Flavobacterium selenitireducens]MBD3582027.1 phosphatase PAP2 family protein [Flavobacterium selenitireducens]
MNRLACLVFLALLSYVQSAGQEAFIVETDSIPAQTSLWEDLKYDGTSVYKGVLHVYSRPAHWKKDDWLTAGCLTATTAMMWLGDEPLNEYFLDQGSNAPGILKDGAFYFGKPLYNYGITGGIYAFGLLTRNQKVRKTGVLLITSATAGGVLQTVLKNATGRARPGTGKGPASFEPFSKEPGMHSFPSGHTILSFTTAYAISKQFKSPWVKGGLWALGMVTPVSRMWENAHWSSDIAAGVIISVVTVECIDKYLNRERNYDSYLAKKKISWNLNFSRQTIGVVGTF